MSSRSGMNPAVHSTQDDDLDGRIYLVTGANTGIGEVTARELARRRGKVWMACRSEARAREAMARIRQEVPRADLEFLALDLSDLASVREASEELSERATDGIDVLINNAGLAGQRGLTQDGFELTFGVNHLGHFLFTERVRPMLRSDGRIVIVASRAHYDSPEWDWDALQRPTRSVSGMPEYRVSKLANVLHAKALARRAKGATVYSLHPGVVASDVWRHVPWPIRSLMKLFMISNEDGAKTSLHCATSPSVADENGLYYSKCTTKEPSGRAHDESLQEELWARSAQWVGLS